MHGLAVCVKEGLPFAWDLFLENLRILSYVFDWLDFTQCPTPCFIKLMIIPVLIGIISMII